MSREVRIVAWCRGCGKEVESFRGRRFHAYAKAVVSTMCEVCNPKQRTWKRVR